VDDVDDGDDDGYDGDVYDAAADDDDGDDVDDGDDAADDGSAAAAADDDDDDDDFQILTVNNSIVKCLRRWVLPVRRRLALFSVDLRSGEGLLRFEILSERWCEMFYCEITPKLSIIFSERRRLDRSSCKKFHEAFLHIYVYIYIYN
jgi:hypothetical protein